MATNTYSKSSEGKTIGTGLDYTYTVEAFTVPAGETFKRYRVRKGTSISGMDLRSISGQSSHPSWDTWSTNTDLIGWSNGKTSKVKVHNSNSVGRAFSVKIEFETDVIPYTKVKAGNSIKATDRSQTGTSTTQGNVMKDSHFSAGTIATASAFNEKVLGL